MPEKQYWVSKRLEKRFPLHWQEKITVKQVLNCTGLWFYPKENSYSFTEPRLTKIEGLKNFFDNIRFVEPNYILDVVETDCHYRAGIIVEPIEIVTYEKTTNEYLLDELATYSQKINQITTSNSQK